MSQLQKEEYHIHQIIRALIAQNYIKLDGPDAQKMLKLYDVIEDNDDVQKVYANFDIDESEME
jgi:transcriptional/translational regulatory protein YebC/TACO1